MKGSIVLNQAVPSMGLLKFGDDSKLALETSSWMHLNCYVGKVESLPEEFDSGSSAISEALDTVRSEIQRFGAPRRLRKFVQENPNALADNQPPAMLYAGIVWLVQGLHDSAAFAVSTLQSLMELADSSKNIKIALQLLGRRAQDARSAIGPLKDSLKTFKAGILNANSGLSDAYRADAEVLSQLQETVGGLQVRVDILQKQVEQLGFLSSKKKKRDLTQQLYSLQQELEDNLARAEKLRITLGELEPILDEGHWLKSGVDDLVGFLDKVRGLWTTFGSGCAQLAADASDTQLEDSAWMEKALGFNEAIKQWKAIDRAAKQFTVESLVDFPSD